MASGGEPAKASFLGFKARLARSAAGVTAMFNDEAVREKVARKVSSAVSSGGASFRASLSAVLAKVQEADAVRSLMRRGGEEEAANVDLEVGPRVYEEVPRHLRTHLWLSLLDQAEPPAASAAPAARPGRRRRAAAAAAEAPEQLDDLAAMLCEGEYYAGLLETFDSGGPRSNPSSSAGEEGFVEDVGSVIRRDISRTFPQHAFFAKPAGRATLQRLLHAYAIHDPAVGYCQGMAFVAGMLLMYLEEGRAFAAFCTLMHAGRLRALYLPGMAELQARLRQLGELLRRRSPRLAAHLAVHDVSPVIYASSWFLTLFAAEFPTAFTARLMDVCLAERSSAAMIRVALGLLDGAEAQLLELHSFEDLVVYLKVELKNWPKERLRETLTLSLHMEGINDESLDALAAEMARAEEAAAARSARRGGPATGEAAAAAAPPPAALLGEDEEFTRPPEGAIRTRSSSVIEVLLDMDLGSSRSRDGDAADAWDDWERVEAPLSGGVPPAEGAAPDATATAAAAAAAVAEQAQAQAHAHAAQAAGEEEGEAAEAGGAEGGALVAPQLSRPTARMLQQAREARALMGDMQVDLIHLDGEEVEVEALSAAMAAVSPSPPAEPPR